MSPGHSLDRFGICPIAGNVRTLVGQAVHEKNGDNKMTILKKTCGFLVILTSLNGHAQSSDAGGATEPAKGITSSQPDMAPPDAKAAKKAGKQSNQALQNDVRRALSRTKGLNVADVTVHVRGGAVTLQGYMQSQTQADQAAEVAKSVKGVTSVTNHIGIRPTMGS